MRRTRRRGAAFYPIYSTQSKAKDCAWQEGGTLIPGTTNTFDGTSTSEYGPELSLFYPAFPSRPAGTDVNNYRNVLSRNPASVAARFRADDLSQRARFRLQGSCRPEAAFVASSLLRVVHKQGEDSSE